MKINSWLMDGTKSKSKIWHTAINLIHNKVQLLHFWVHFQFIRYKNYNTINVNSTIQFVLATSKYCDTNKDTKS